MCLTIKLPKNIFYSDHFSNPVQFDIVYKTVNIKCILNTFMLLNYWFCE